MCALGLTTCIVFCVAPTLQIEGVPGVRVCPSAS